MQKLQLGSLTTCLFDPYELIINQSVCLIAWTSKYGECRIVSENVKRILPVITYINQQIQLASAQKYKRMKRVI